MGKTPEDLDELIKIAHEKQLEDAAMSKGGGRVHVYCYSPYTTKKGELGFCTGGAVRDGVCSKGHTVPWDNIICSWCEQSIIKPTAYMQPCSNPKCRKKLHGGVCNSRAVVYH